MSLESGTTLCRLNHVLLPEPGSPIASTTIPLGGRCGAEAAAGTFGTSIIGPAAASASPSGVSSSTGEDVVAPFTAAGVKA